MAKIFIDGEAGTTGLGIRARLQRWAEIELISLDEASRKDKAARLEAMRAVDLVVLCLPDDAAREAAAMATSLDAAAPKLLDASTAHRVTEGWVYGLPELSETQAKAIASARFVSNPGCYATGAILLLRPLVDAGLLSPDQDVSINAVSGYSGGGKAMIAAHEAAAGPMFELYALGLAHKHLPEIIKHSGLTQRPIFVPAVGHFRQGMLVSIPLFLDRLAGQPSGEDIVRVYQAHYQDLPHIRPPCSVTALDLEPQALNGTDLLEIFVAANGAQAVLTARLDNLGKGASGAAVQNIALMLGLNDMQTHTKELSNA